MIESHHLYCGELDRVIPVHVRIPLSYFDSPSECYPVIYMFDGQNLFYDSWATFGTSWGLDEFLASYSRSFIVVGLECDHRGNNRLSEYCPYDVSSSPIGSFPGRGDLLFSWIVSSLKPFIDSAYRTLPGRENTALAGSSMGGVMAYYGLLAYNSIFSKAACLSPSLFLHESRFLALADGISSSTRCYLSAGEREPHVDLGLFGSVVPESMVYIQPSGEHNEASWRLLSSMWFDFLWK